MNGKLVFVIEMHHIVDTLIITSTLSSFYCYPRVLDAVIQSKGVDLYLHVLPAVERMLSASSLPIVSASTPDQTCGRRSKLRR